MGPDPLVSVIVVNHNGAGFLKACLDSIASQTYANRETILVDNGSSDGSVEFVKKDYPQAKVVENGKNLGYAAGANRGIEVSKGEFVALLNNDAKADPRWIENLVAAIRKDGSIGSCASKQLDFNDPGLIDSTGIMLQRWAYPVSRGHGETDRGQFNVTGEVFGAAGASAIYRRQMLDQVGLFDEDFFAYQEELDLSFRGRLRGWKCVYVPGAVVYHMGGRTRAKEDEKFRIYYMERNRLLMIAKDYSSGMLIRYLPYLLKYELDILLRLVTRLETAPIRARFGALRLLPSMLGKRRTIQGERTVPDSGIERWIIK